MARHGQGRALLRLGQTSAGMALLDEVMVGVTGGEVGAATAGVIYCSVISACHDLLDLRRAQEWTSALHDWCASRPDLVPFRGHCLVRRAELLTLHGAWQDARDEARRACDQLKAARRREAGAAAYQLGDLHRLAGELTAAEDAYRLASQAGYTANPGLALLRLAQGHAEAARTSIGLALQERRAPRQRIDLLAAAVDIMLARGDVADAESAANELSQIARDHDVAFARGRAAQARGAVLLAAGNAAPALAELQSAGAAWQEIDAPYELARTRMLVGLAYQALGDRDGARLEFEAAHDVFDRIRRDPRRRPRREPVSGRRRRGRRSDRSGGRSTQARRDRGHQPDDRRAPGHQREDRGPSHQQHLHETRPAVTRGRDGIRLRAQARLGVLFDRVDRNTHATVAMTMDSSIDARLGASAVS